SAACASRETRSWLPAGLRFLQAAVATRAPGGTPPQASMDGSPLRQNSRFELHHSRNIGAGTEVPFCAGDHDGADGNLVRKLGEHFRDRLPHFLGKRVVPVRLTQGDDGDRTPEFQQHFRLRNCHIVVVLSRMSFRLRTSGSLKQLPERSWATSQHSLPWGNI